MSRTVVGLFDHTSDVQAAADELASSGVPLGHVSIIKDSDSASETCDPGLAGARKVAIPGLGVACARGPMMTGPYTVLAFGIAAALVKAGMSEDLAFLYQKGVRRGGTLLCASVSEGRAQAVADILSANHAIDVRRRARQWAAEEAEIDSRRQDRLPPGWHASDATSQRAYAGAQRRSA